MAATLCDTCLEPRCVTCDDVTDCAGGGEHCGDCADGCGPCGAEAAREFREEQAEDIRRFGP